MLSDLKYAFRQLAKSPAFTVIAVLILALGIGANTAIFTVIDAVMLSALPVKAPQQLVFLTDPNYHGVSTGFEPQNRRALTYAEFRDLHDRNTAFSGLLAVGAQNYPMDAVAEADGQSRSAGRPVASLVSGSYFTTLGVTAAAGRTFGEEIDKVRDANPVAVLSHSYWVSQFAGDPKAVGQKLHLRGTSYDIIGVAQAGFFGETFGANIDVWIPVTMQAEVVPGSDYLSIEKNPFAKQMWLEVIGRLKPGLSAPAAKAAANLTFRQYLETQLSGVPQDKQKDFLSQNLILTDGRRGGSTLRQSYDAPLTFLMLLVALLLLVACTNVGNLLLTRATFRQREMAIRIAVGAGSGRIVRQLLTESILLATLGGALGLLLAHWGDQALLYVAGRHLDLHPDGQILGFTLGISMLVGVAFGIAPAVRAARVDLNTALKNKGGVRVGHFSLSRIFVVTQVSLSLLLLILAGLFVRSFQKLEVVNLGYDRDHLLVFHVSTKDASFQGTGTSAGYQGAAVRALYDRLSARIRVIPGVKGVTFSLLALLTGSEAGEGIAIDGVSPGRGQEMIARLDEVGPNYFTIMGIPLLLGREITAQDEAGGQRVGLINQTMARYYFGDANPLGRRILIADDSLGRPYPAFIVIGVSADAKQHNAREIPNRRFYLPYFNNPLGQPTDAEFAVRSVGDPAGVIAAIRTAVSDIAPNLPPIGIQTIDEIADQQLEIDRLLTKLSGFFGLLAAVLAATGIYGLMSYSVARRSPEIGLRMALGAQRGDVLRLILDESLLLVALGIALGVPASLGAARLLNHLLFGLGLADPAVLALAVALMIVVGAGAALAPALRACKVDPLIALRTE